MHVLPLAGGLFDQPGSWLMKMEAVFRADAEQERVSGGAKIEAERKLETRVSGLPRE